MLTAERLQQRRFLLGCGPIVDIADGAPVALEHVAGDEHGDTEVQARHVDALDLAVLDLIGQRGLAGAIVGVLADPTGAEGVAVANLEQVALEPIGHMFLPRVSRLAQLPGRYRVALELAAEVRRCKGR